MEFLFLVILVIISCKSIYSFQDSKWHLQGDVKVLAMQSTTVQFLYYYQLQLLFATGNNIGLIMPLEEKKL